MSKTIELTDEQYAAFVTAAQERGQSPAMLIAEVAEELRDPVRRATSSCPGKRTSYGGGLAAMTSSRTRNRAAVQPSCTTTLSASSPDVAARIRICRARVTDRRSNSAPCNAATASSGQVIVTDSNSLAMLRWCSDL